jgi:hypothetical protein
MHRLAAALIGALTILLLVFSTASAHDKVFVCKYVGTPGDSERLQTGQNPISVSTSAIKEDPVVIGSYFVDAQGRSFVLAFDIGQDEPDVSECPGSDEPSSEPSSEATPTPPEVTPTPSLSPSDAPSVAPSVDVTPTPVPVTTEPPAVFGTPPPTDTEASETSSSSDMRLPLILIIAGFALLTSLPRFARRR